MQYLSSNEARTDEHTNNNNKNHREFYLLTSRLRTSIYHEIVNHVRKIN